MPLCKSITIATLTFTLFSFLFFSINHATAAASGAAHLESESESESGNSECEGRWVHIRKLPSRFNLDLLTNCSAYPIYDDFCPFLANHGLGHKTHNRSHSWYRTDPFMLELLFHRRILEYPCLTPDPSIADAIFLPYYGAIDSLRYLYGPEVNSSADHGLSLYRFLQKNNPKIWSRYSGHDHFLVLARPAWDFSQPLSNDPPLWGTSFLELPQFYNITALTLESRPWPWQEHAVPYPTSFHPPTLALLYSWIARVRRARRTTLMLFAGGGGVASAPNVRHSIRSECENSTAISNNPTTGTTTSGQFKDCQIVDCSNGVCEHDPIRFMRPMLQSSFCLQPPGDTPTRRSTFDGILAGCIPVFFEELSAKSQFGWHLPEDQYREFSVFIPKEEVVAKGLRITSVLKTIPAVEVRRMRDKLIDMIPRIMYRRHGSSLGLRAEKDAFDLAVEGALGRIRTRIEGLRTVR
ncbi:probable xyloglucan galactosyltransferase GT19 [Macadamia integrifolia]|uniref:probable xyloglucan galactosyltransferase GT19 n=1 Tax=Macadamia integrifolia TaxID=60698 RepID=UPI001C4E8920|nr:probable xyloglucan galactosyltransferase GT19 [Macadamia integrifolia]